MVISNAVSITPTVVPIPTEVVVEVVTEVAGLNSNVS